MENVTSADAEVVRILEGFRRFDAYTLGDAARRAMTGGILQQLKPQSADTTFVGRALTARLCYEQNKKIPLNEYGAAQLREHVQPGDVIVLDAGGLMMSAMGELAFAHLVSRGAAGAVVNGCVRDVEQLEEMALGLPVFALGTAIPTVAGSARIVDIGCTLYLSGVRIDTGDLVAGCRGGVVVVPWQDQSAVFDEAQRIADSDRLVRDGLKGGESMSQLWQKHKSF